MFACFSSKAPLFFLALNFCLVLLTAKQRTDSAWARCPTGSQCKNLDFSGSKIHKVRVVSPTPTKPSRDQLTQLKAAAGFGQASKVKKDTVGTGAKALKKQITSFMFMKEEENAKPVEVFIKVQGSENWNKCGQVTAEGNDYATGTKLQEDLIINHAKEQFSFLKGKSSLQLGFGSESAVTEVPKINPQFITCGFMPHNAGSGGAFFKSTDQFGLQARVDVRSKSGSVSSEDESEVAV